ncbi:glycosyltransferase family 2 protein [Pedobacter sp. MW01-1-1]|uniref:glycosyltransferase family 2 protein n=1 Tax=Pedobacter sp. MW01-1-1 TaxID=3383027 RepID=UPI003FEF3469
MLNHCYSLLVPCYNAEAYLDAFIENIEALEKPFDEVIFYDDASSDNTYEQLKSKGYQVIKGLENKGPAYARNQLIRIAQGDFIHFHDIDDGLHASYLVETATVLENNQQLDVVLCNVKWYDAATKKPVLSWEYSQQEINKIPLVYTISHPIGGINGLYKKEVLIAIGGFNEQLRIWEDADLHVRLAHFGAKFQVIEKELSYAYRYADSASSNQNLAWKIRFNLLRQYANTYSNNEVQFAIGAEAQKVASSFILMKEFQLAKEAFQLSENCKLKVPFKSSLFWKIYKFILPRSWRIKFRMFHLKKAFKK